MTIWYKSKFLLLAILLTCCACAQRSLISLDGSQTIDLTRVALIVEDQNFPALFRGLDGVPLDSMRVPTVFGRYAYVMSPGPHMFWLKGSPYPHPLVPQRIRCYTMHVELQPGVGYILKEETADNKVLLVREDTGETVSTGELVDEPLVFQRDCKW